MRSWIAGAPGAVKVSVSPRCQPLLSAFFCDTSRSLPEIFALPATIGTSVTDPGWLDEVPAGGRVLIVAEGLLMYLTPADVTELLNRLVDRFDTGQLLADLMSKWGPRQSKIVAPGLIKWGTRDGGEITRWDARLRLIEDSPVIAGFDKISLTPQRLLYRVAYAIPANRNYDRLFRYAF